MSLFSRILPAGPLDWDAATPAQKVDAIAQLAPEDPRLAQLAIQDADAGVRQAALGRMAPASLWDLTATVQPGDEDTLAALLLPTLQAEAPLPEALAHASPALRISLAAHLQHEAAALAVLALIERDEDRAAVARGRALISVRAAAARAIRDTALLEALAAEFRDKQKNVHRAARERADELAAASAAGAGLATLCAKLEDMVAGQHVSLSAVVQIEREHEALSARPAPDNAAELQARYAQALAQAREQLQGQADVWRRAERLKADVASLAERSGSDAAVDEAALQQLAAEREALAAQVAGAGLDALPREREQLRGALERLTERHAVLRFEAGARASAGQMLAALRADAAQLTPAWRAEFARLLGILRPGLRLLLQQEADALLGGLAAAAGEAQAEQQAAGQQWRSEIEALLKQMEQLLDKGQHQQAAELGEQLKARREAEAAASARSLPAALEFRIKRCQDRLAKLHDWKRFADMQARELLCKEAEALARKVARQFPAAEPARPGFKAPAENFAWPVSPIPQAAVEPAAESAAKPASAPGAETIAPAPLPEHAASGDATEAAGVATPAAPAVPGPDAATPANPADAGSDTPAAVTPPAAGPAADALPATSPDAPTAATGEAAATSASGTPEAAEPPLTPEHIAQTVRELQARWHQLDQNKTASTKGLWERFRRACDRAYAPARRHFDALEEQRSANAGKKQAVLDRLAALNERIADGADWGRILGERGELVRAWFEGGTLPRKDARAMHKRFDTLSGEIDAKLETRRQAERTRRKALIEEAKAIAERPADGASMAAMIALQKRWQDGMKGAIRLKSGEDKALWETFRSAGSALFGKRDAEKAARNAEREAQFGERRKLIEDMQALARSEDAVAIRRGVESISASWQALDWPERRPVRDIEQKFAAARTAAQGRVGALRAQVEERQRTAAVARLAIIGKAEQALQQGTTPDLEAVKAEIQASLAEGEKPDARVSARLEALGKAIEAGPDAWRARADQSRGERDALLLELEIVLDLPSPPELAGERRMRMFKRLAESKNARATPPLMAAGVPQAVDRLLAMPMATQGAEQRVEAVIKAAGRLRR